MTSQWMQGWWDDQGFDEGTPSGPVQIPPGPPEEPSGPEEPPDGG